MKNHLDQTDLLEILYLDETSEDRAQHLATCTSCHDRFAELRSEIELDRSALDTRVESKPEQFWREQRDEIVATAVARSRLSFAFVRLRYAFSIAMAVLLLAVGLVLIRTASLNQIAPLPTDVATIGSTSSELFEDEDVRKLDPWETDELESFHQIVEWEEWLDDDVSTERALEEES